MTQRVHLGSGAIQHVVPIFDQKNAGSIFVVADQAAYELSGARAKLASALDGRRCFFFEEFAPNPKFDDVMKGLKCWREHPCDMILAVGGGSAIDMAKLIGICSAHEHSPVDLMTGRVPIDRAGVPLVALPTTAGTGSEATHFAVVYVDGQKYSLAHAFVLPDYAVIDSDLTADLPASITAHTGLDVLSQAMESLWSVNATDASREFAGEALSLAMANLVPAVLNPEPSVRLNMCRAAHLAGKAINISKTTAPHAISYTLTSHFGVPHGLAVALSLGQILVFNCEVTEEACCHPDGVVPVRESLNTILSLLGADDGQDAKKRLEDLMTTIGCPTRLGDVGVQTDADIEMLVDHVNTERLQNNPRMLSRGALVHLLNGIR
jgi:alcohol dehydrogenase class IV